MRDRIGIAGAGRMAQAMGRLLRERGQPVVAVAGRDPARVQAAAGFVGGAARAITYAELPALAGRILIAVPDDAIAGVAALLAEGGMRSGAALHTSGSSGAEALAELAARGVSCGSLHPLQTVAAPEQGVAALPGSAFAIEGQGEAGAWAEEIAALFGGQLLRIDAAHRPLYHAAAAMASNYVTALLDAAAILMKEAGIPEAQALPALAPLVRSTVENAVRWGPAAALTGPIERGDAGTVAAHLRALASAPDSVRRLYRAAGRQALELASRKNPGADRRNIELLLRDQCDDQRT